MTRFVALLAVTLTMFADGFYARGQSGLISNFNGTSYAGVVTQMSDATAGCEGACD